MSREFQQSQQRSVRALTIIVPDEVKAKYVTIIDEILESSDLAQITEKRIRNGIQDKVEYDILPQKV